MHIDALTYRGHNMKGQAMASKITLKVGDDDLETYDTFLGLVEGMLIDRNEGEPGGYRTLVVKGDVVKVNFHADPDDDADLDDDTLEGPIDETYTITRPGEPFTTDEVNVMKAIWRATN